MKKGSILKSILMGAMALVFAVGMVTLQQPNKVEALTSGWVQSGDYWYYYNNGTKLTGWQKISGYWYYFDDYGRMYDNGAYYVDGEYYFFNVSGQMQTGWCSRTYYDEDNIGWTDWYYADSNGVLKCDEWAYISGHWYYFNYVWMVNDCWYQVDNVWYYFNVSGQKTSTGSGLTGWQKMNGYWFYFIKPGVEAHGWQQISGKWYYFNQYNDNGCFPGSMYYDGFYYIDDNEYFFTPGGTLVTGWFRNPWNGLWCYANSSGAIQYGWINDGGKWYYIGDMYDANGNWYDWGLYTGWQVIDGDWYYFSGSGVMQTGWVKLGNNYYYFNSNGKMVTGWQKINNSWYYFSANGIMATGWQTIGGSSYYFYSGGQMAANTWIGNYHVNGSGVWDTTR